MSENEKTRIEWEHHPSSQSNRGTDGHGLVALQDIIGRRSRIVALEFRFYIEDHVELDGDRLRELSQKIGDLIHEHLDA